MKPGWQTTEFWLTLLTKPLTAILTFLATAAVTHQFVTSTQAGEAVAFAAPVLASAAATFAASAAVRVYTEARTRLKIQALASIPVVGATITDLTATPVKAPVP